MTPWPDVPVVEAFRDATGGNAKVPATEYLASGLYPVIDQGNSDVAGYTNERERLCRTQGPVVLFGDHTRAFKYVDRRFALGADGVKVLAPREGWDTKYLYWALRSLDLPSAGYSRHFKFLKERSIARPPIQEQRKIAAILDQADTLRGKRRESIAHLDVLARAAFMETFGDPLSNPRDLPIQLLDAWVDPDRPVTYGILKPGPDVADGVPYVRVADMRAGGIALPRVKRTSTAIALQYKRSTLQAGDLLISIRGHVGRMAEVPAALDGANITQDSARLAVDCDSVEYVRGALECESVQAWMARRVRGAAVQGLNLGDLRLVPLPLPPLRELQDFGRLARTIRCRREVARRQLVECDALAASLAHHAFTGDL
ncbi:hypothetical protein [Actinotalea sp. K2]|uniref:restriction endonuclease subunit S n=1 Tax=Actinotalea sp. K2 TaxID=2939438 RepID=UPI002016A9A6|nr:hypothetical protein [Actinotalea sp. K2]MCL3862047.1 hypothetical protein [Actinotalea sp. K2]